MPRSKESKETKDSTEYSTNLEKMLEQIAEGMLNLQATVGVLASNLQKSDSVSTDKNQANVNSSTGILHDRSYLVNWRELGGSSLTFYPNSKCHPMQFLKKLNKIFEEAGVPEERKMGLATGCLKGTAGDWVAVKEPSFKTYEDFVHSFKSRFWGLDKQRELFLEIQYGRFESGNRSDYFLNLINQASFLEEKISDKDLIEKISKHFPTEVRRGIITQGLHTIDSVEEYLRKIDDTYDEKSNDNSRAVNRNNFPPNNSGNNRRYAPNNNNQNRDSNVQNEPANQRRQVNLITQFNKSTENLLCVEDEQINKNDVVMPIIQGKIGNNEIGILIDSGSEISAIAEDHFNNIKDDIRAPVLPVAGVSISLAVGGKMQRVKHQVLLPIRIDDIRFEVVCLIVPKLNREVLLGSDFLSKHKAQLNFNDLTLKMSLDNKIYNLNFDYNINNGKSLFINLCKEEQICAKSPSIIEKHQYNDSDFQSVVEKSNLNNENDKDKLKSLLNNHRELFSECPGLTNVYEHEIFLHDDEPFYVRSYPIPIVHRKDVNAQIKEMLDWGIISAEHTEYVCPLVTVTKKDKSVRVCLDARALNNRMNKDYIPPPNANELLLSFKQGQILSSIDLTASYWQIPIKKSHRKYVGFLYEDQTYVFNVLPFGLSTSMASLIRCLTKVLGGECSNFTFCYVDDLLIFSDNIEKHFIHLNIIFNKLRDAGFTIKLRKSQFFRETVLFLGHIISSKGISMDTNRISAIEKFCVPRNLKELRGFLGLVNYEQRFCQNYADLTIPLLKLLKKGVKWNWGVEQQEAFIAIKQAFLQTTLLVHPNLEDTFFVQCDSSNYGVGGCLYQIDAKSGEKGIIAFTSRTLKGSELNYTVSEKETVAIVHCLRQWRTFVLGRRLVVITDHKSLTFLLKSKLHNARLARWALFLQEFDFEILHCSGKENTLADVLSRYPLKESNELKPDNEDNVEIFLINLSPNYKQLRQNFKNIREDQLNDENFGSKMIFLERYPKEVKIITEKELKLLEWYVVHEGILFKRGNNLNRGYKLCVPKNQRVELVKAQHAEIGHFGKSKTYDHMKTKFYWQKMQKNIRKIVASCDLCQKSKCSQTSSKLLNPIIVKEPAELVCADLMGPLPVSRGGATMLLVLVDAFTKYVKLYSLKRATTVTILNKIIKHYIPSVQKPRCILTDNGTQFTSKLWKNTFENALIKVKTTSVYFPQGNITERYNKEVGRLLRMFCHEKHTKWACCLETVEHCLNNVVNDSTGYTATFLQTGKVTTNSIEKIVNFPKCEHEMEGIILEHFWILARDRLRSKAERRADKANRGCKPTIFKEGDAVLVRVHAQSSAENRTIRKLFLLYEGPFYVLRQAGPNSYVIADEMGREIAKHNVINLKPYKTPTVECD